MFRKRTAWFSNSVGQRYQKYWMSEGGHIVSWRTAEYLFSEDASNPDTLRLFESKSYQRGRLTVFHSLFLCACERRDSAGSVCIGHYVLPPLCVQEEVRSVVGRLIWEREDDQWIRQGSWCKQPVEEDSRTTTHFNSSCEHLDTEMSQNEGTACCEVQQLPISSTATGLISMNMLARYSGDLCDITPPCATDADHCGCSVCQ